MTKGKIYPQLGFVAGGITEDQLIEFDKISNELRRIFAENRAVIRRKQKERKRRYKDSRSIRYGVLD